MQVTIDQAQGRARLAKSGDIVAENQRLRNALSEANLLSVEIKAEMSILRGRVAELERKITDGVAERDLPALPGMRRIAEATAGHFNLTTLDLRSSRRDRISALARHVAMFIIKSETLHSFPEIGRFFGHREHTSVQHAVKNIEHKLAADEDLAEAIHAIRMHLKEETNGQA